MNENKQVDGIDFAINTSEGMRMLEALNRRLGESNRMMEATVTVTEKLTKKGQAYYTAIIDGETATGEMVSASLKDKIHKSKALEAQVQSLTQTVVKGAKAQEEAENRARLALEKKLETERKIGMANNARAIQNAKNQAAQNLISGNFGPLPSNLSPEQVVKYSTLMTNLQRSINDPDISINRLGDIFTSLTSKSAISMNEMEAKVQKSLHHIGEFFAELGVKGSDAWRKISVSQESAMDKAIASLKNVQYLQKLRIDSAKAEYDSLAPQREEARSLLLGAIYKARSQNLDNVLSSHFGQLPANLNPSEIVRLAEARKSLMDAIMSSNFDATRLGSIVQKLKSGVAHNFEGADLEVSKAANHLISEYTRINVAGTEMWKTQDKALQSFNLGWQNFAKFFTIHIAYTAFFQLTQALKEGVKAANELEKKVAEIQGISQESPMRTTDLTMQLLGKSTALGFDINEVAKTNYEVVSNQLATGQSSLNFMDKVSEFARATNVDLFTAQETIASGLNAYNRGIGASDEISSKFFELIKLGRVRADELGKSIGRVLAPAEELGVSMDDVGTVMAALSIKGLRFSEVMTQVNALFNSAVSPTAKMSERFKELGFESGVTAIKTLGLVGYIKMLTNEINAGNISLAEASSNSRARRGLQAFMGDTNFDKLIEDAKKFTTATKEYRTAVEMVSGTDAVKWEKTGASIHAFWVNLASGVKKLARNTLDGLDDISNKVNNAVGDYQFDDRISGKLKTMSNVMVDTESAGLKVVQDALSKRKQAMDQYLINSRLSFNREIEQIGRSSEEIAKRIESSFERAFDRVEKELGQLRSNIDKLKSSQMSQSEKADDARLKKLSPTDQVAFLQNKFDALKGRGIELLNAGNIEQGTKKLEEAQRVLDRMVELRDQLFTGRKENLDKIVELQKDGKSTSGLESQVKQQEEALKRLDYSEYYNQVFDGNRVVMQKTSDLVKVQDDFIQMQLEANQKRLDIIGGQGATADQAQARLQASKDEVKVILDELRKYKPEGKNLDTVYADMNRLAGGALANLTGPSNYYTDVVNQINVLRGQIEQSARLTSSSKNLGDTSAIQKQIDEVTKLGDAYNKTANDIGSLSARYYEVIPRFQLAESLFPSLFGGKGLLGDQNQALEKILHSSQSQRDAIKKETQLQIRSFESTWQDSSATGGVTESNKQGVIAFLQNILDLTTAINENKKTEAELNRSVFGISPELLRNKFKAQDLALAKTPEEINRANAGIGPYAHQFDVITAIRKQSEDLSQKILQSVDQTWLEPAVQLLFDKSNSFEFFTDAQMVRAGSQVLGLTNLVSVTLGSEIRPKFDSILDSYPAIYDILEQANIKVNKDLDTVITKLDESLGKLSNLQNAKTLETITKAGIQGLANTFIKPIVTPTAPAAPVTGPSFTDNTTRWDMMFGIPNFKAAGGPIPGIDNIPAMLSPGEFVINPISSARFFPQLKAINAGFAPRGMAAGGPTANFGDINVTVNEAKSPAQTARAIGQSIRREMERRSFSFGG